MSARAASAFARQAQQRHRARPKHDAKSRLFFSGVIMAIANGYTGGDTANGQSSAPRSWRTDVFDWVSAFAYDRTRLNEHLIDKELLELHPDTGKLVSTVTESTVYKVQDIEDLVALNRLLDSEILKGNCLNPDTGETDQRKHELALQPLEKCGKWVQNSPTEQTAVRRLQHLIATKLRHVRVLQDPHEYYLEALSIGKAYEKCLSEMS
eukprot:Blabericola_migrator_1__5777@NODE_2929_length_2200_cov_71_541960_g1836_i0_p1_GENE_NODE_2929_length_2200_cov_71_541960_g1836_i0NODE_2929_length_2200_cov_71_541960_g1836_i0_p1_ORF_typecomplete_len209_score43_85_NODE_2929_length_2200_cov_71_541960_g1836_i06721298